MRVIYVAGRFTALSTELIEENIRRAEQVGAEVVRLGASPLIPHANTRNFVGTATPEFWYRATLALMLKCDAVLTVPGWEASVGAAEEVRVAVARGIPVFHDPISLGNWLEACR